VRHAFAANYYTQQNNGKVCKIECPLDWWEISYFVEIMQQEGAGCLVVIMGLLPVVHGGEVFSQVADELTSNSIQMVNGPKSSLAPPSCNDTSAPAPSLTG